MVEFRYQEIFEHGADTTAYRQLTSDYVSTTTFEGQEIVKIAPEALTLLAREAMDDVAHLLRPGHLQQLAYILDDPEASDNDRFVALELLKNANIAAGRVLPGCQDTGTAIVLGYKGQQVFTPGDDAEALSHGIYQAYQERDRDHAKRECDRFEPLIQTQTHHPPGVVERASLQGSATPRQTAKEL